MPHAWVASLLRSDERPWVKRMPNTLQPSISGDDQDPIALAILGELIFSLEGPKSPFEAVPLA